MANTTNRAIRTQATAASVQELGKRWSAAQGGSAVLLWRFAHSVLAYQIANPKVTGTAIGEACATACGRAKPYSKGWVSRAVNAARAIGHEPTTPEETTKFYDLFHGVDSAKRADKAKQEMTAEEALKAAIAFARKAVKLGAETDAVLEAMADALDPNAGTREVDAATA